MALKIKQISDNIIRQLFLIVMIGVTAIIIIFELRYFIPGLLGAITLYILFRKPYYYLTEAKKWNKHATSIFLILLSFVTIAVPLWVLVEILIPQISSLIANKDIAIQKFNALKTFLSSKPLLNKINLSEENLLVLIQKITAYLPRVFNSAAAVLVNLATAFFILYFMQVRARAMESRIKLLLPISEEDTQSLWNQTNLMVRSNALGIPILALCQGLVAALGYILFGVENALLWGLLTGAATIVPAIGTMIVWVPIVLIQFGVGHTASAIGLTLYCLIVVGGIDNVLRFTILKKLGDVHPLITVFGVILGLNLFGLMGLIFGPLLLSYFGILIELYRTEFGRKKKTGRSNDEAKSTLATVPVEPALPENSEIAPAEKLERQTP